MGLQHITSSFFYFICKDNLPTVYHFNPSDNSVKKVSVNSTKNIDNKKVLKYSAPEDGYYITILNNKMSVSAKGDIKYYAFLFNGKNDSDSISIKANFIDETTQDIEFKKIEDKIYAADVSSIKKVGWFNLNGLSSINPMGFKARVGKSITTISNVISKSAGNKPIKTTMRTPIITSSKENSVVIEYNNKSNSSKSEVKSQTK